MRRASFPADATLREVGEWALIAAIAEQLPPAPPGWQGIGDDAASTCLTPGRVALTTTDLLVEDVHFRRSTITPHDLGHKALAVNLSDIAAMGGCPRWAVVGLAAPADTPLGWVLAFYRGLAALAERTQTAIVGGDTTCAPGGIVIALTVVGEAARPRTRASARPGDRVFVTGPCGLSAAGLWCLEHPTVALEAHIRHTAEQAHRCPEPQLAAARQLAALDLRLALIDDSDGLARSASALATASGVDLWLARDQVPLAPATRAVATAADSDPLGWALDGGEDYGLVGCVAPADWPALEAALRTVGVTATCVGGVRAGHSRVWLRAASGHESPLLDVAGFRHFA